jgi:hypothetical protein
MVARKIGVEAVGCIGSILEQICVVYAALSAGRF